MSKTISSKRIRGFRKEVYGYFRKHKRDFSWRRTRDPYHVLVSEIMLQQTQTDRVEKKFSEFIAAFPDVEALARAPLKDIMRVWQGMGYNRRALYLQQAAQEVVRRHSGILPRSVEALDALPGIGPATARSIAAYAFGLPVAFIETNIRTVFIHEFFKGDEKVSDEKLLPLVEQTLDAKDPWTWYNALMDYGVMLKEKHGNPGRRSAHYKKQSPFKESDRRVRGKIMRYLSHHEAASEKELSGLVIASPAKLRRCLKALVKDGLAVRRGNRYSIP